uniref:Uncharacterized protein n=1 Tax=Graphocephala atropunctata TaxID=36148 RepID=A0A1B6LBW0_9HEMI
MQKKLKRAKTKVFRVKNQEIHLCRKAMLISANHHKCSIVASSFLQTYEDELERLQKISDAIKRVQLPNFSPDSQDLSRHNLLPKVNTPVALSDPPVKEVEAYEKKLESKGESKMRSMLTTARRDRQRREKQQMVYHFNISVNADL